MNTSLGGDEPALIYCRESRDDCGEKYERIETQRNILLDFCSKNGINNIAEIVMDDNVSGTSFERLDEIKNKIKDGKIKIFICKDASRLGRNLLESLKFIQYAQDYGVKIIFESEEFNPELFPLIAWFNERRAKDDSDKIRRVIHHKMENGLIISVPYGYKKAGKNMVVDEETSKVVRLIFNMAYKGSSVSQIADYLNAIYAKTPSAARNTLNTVNNIWSRDSVRRILKNPVYTGVQVSGKTEKISYKSKKFRAVPAEKQIVIKNHHIPIVSSDLFDGVQEKFGKFKISSRKPTYNPFSGMLFCGKCKNRIIVRQRKDGEPVKYVCSKYNREGGDKEHIREGWGCGAHTVYYDDIKNYVSDYVIGLSQKYAEDKIIEAVKNSSIEKETEHQKNIYAEKEREIISKLNMIYSDRLSGIIPEFMFTERSKRLLDELEGIKAMRKNLEEEDVLPVNEEYKRLQEQIRTSGVSSETIVRLFEKIIVFEPNEISMEYKTKYGISDDKFKQLYNTGGCLFIKRAVI